jgi:hypothetical protein
MGWSYFGLLSPTVVIATAAVATAAVVTTLFVHVPAVSTAVFRHTRSVVLHNIQREERQHR